MTPFGLPRQIYRSERARIGKWLKAEGSVPGRLLTQVWFWEAPRRAGLPYSSLSFSEGLCARGV